MNVSILTGRKEWALCREGGDKLNSLMGQHKSHAVTAILGRGAGKISNSFAPNVHNGKEIYKGLES